MCVEPRDIGHMTASNNNRVLLNKPILLQTIQQRFAHRIDRAKRLTAGAEGFMTWIVPDKTVSANAARPASPGIVQHRPASDKLSVRQDESRCPDQQPVRRPACATGEILRQRPDPLVDAGSLLRVAAGTAVARPPADHGGRNCRTRLLPWMMTHGPWQWQTNRPVPCVLPPFVLP